MFTLLKGFFKLHSNRAEYILIYSEVQFCQRNFYYLVVCNLYDNYLGITNCKCFCIKCFVCDRYQYEVASQISAQCLFSKPTHAILHNNHFFQSQKIANLKYHSIEERLQIRSKQVKSFYFWLQKYEQQFNVHYNIFVFARKINIVVMGVTFINRKSQNEKHLVLLIGLNLF